MCLPFIVFPQGLFATIICIGFLTSITPASSFPFPARVYHIAEPCDCRRALVRCASGTCSTSTSSTTLGATSTVGLGTGVPLCAAASPSGCTERTAALWLIILLYRDIFPEKFIVFIVFHRFLLPIPSCLHAPCPIPIQCLDRMLRACITSPHLAPVILGAVTALPHLCMHAHQGEPLLARTIKVCILCSMER